MVCDSSSALYCMYVVGTTSSPICNSPDSILSVIFFLWCTIGLGIGNDIFPPLSFFLHLLGVLVGLSCLQAAGMSCSARNSLTICPLFEVVRPYLVASWVQSPHCLLSSSNSSVLIVS